MVAEASEPLREVINVLVDGGYNGASFVEFIFEELGARVEVAKCSELHTFAVIPMLSEVFLGLRGADDFGENCGRKISTSLAML